MAARTKRRAHAAKRRNPTRRRSHRAAKRRNPSKVGRATSFAAEGATALVALVATRQLPQMILGASNAGWMGYGANVATALVVGYAAGKFAGPRVQNAALIGGGAYVVSRVLTEQLSPIGQYLSLTGLGDASAATNLGQIHEGYWAHPAMHDASGRPIIPYQITQAAQAGMQPQQAAAPALSGYGRSAY